MANIEITVGNMSKLVNEAFIDCLFEKGEDTSNSVKVEGIINDYGLHPQRLEEKRELVGALLAELSANFKEGYTFLDICNNKNGEQWTGDHAVCEALVVMAIGLGLAEYSFPEVMWKVLPGGVPYITIK